VEILQLPRSLRYTLALICTDEVISSQTPLQRSLNSCLIVLLIGSRHGSCRKHRLLLYSNCFRGNWFFLRRRYSVNAAYACLLKICCLAADVILSFVSKSLRSNGSARYSVLNQAATLVPTHSVSSSLFTDIRSLILYSLSYGELS
jgi:hypothetical protein